MNVRDLADAFRDYGSWATDPRPRIGLGLPFFDHNTNGGIARSEIAMFMAFSSVGKTTFALNAVWRNPDVPILFFSLEMNWRMVAARLAAIYSGMTTRQIEEEYKQGKVPDCVQDVVDRYRLFVCDDTPAITIKDAKDSFHRATDLLGQPPRLVIWDYLELIGGSGLMGKAEQVDRAAEKLRNFGREMDCASVVLHQVGKGDAGGGAEPLDLGSGRYGGHAPMDYVVGSYRPSLEKGLNAYNLSNVREEIYFQLLKNRGGQSEPAPQRYRIHPQTMRIDEWNKVSLPSGYRQLSLEDDDEFRKAVVGV